MALSHSFKRESSSVTGFKMFQHNQVSVQFDIGSAKVEMLIEGELERCVAFISQSSGDFVLHELP